MKVNWLNIAVYALALILGLCFVVGITLGVWYLKLKFAMWVIGV